MAKCSDTIRQQERDQLVLTALRSTLKDDHHQHITKWLSSATPAVKRGVVKLARISPQGFAGPTSPMRRTASSPNFLVPDHVMSSMTPQKAVSLQNAFKNEHHQHLPKSLTVATPEEQRGIRKLAKITEARLTATIGRPVGGSFEPQVAEAPWYCPQGGMNGLTRNRSTPTMGERRMGPPPEYVVPTWMHEDSIEMEKIPKPGGCLLNLRDSVTIQSMKNSQRNQGTYKLFSGQFDGTTTTATAHSLDALTPLPPSAIGM